MNHTYEEKQSFENLVHMEASLIRLNIYFHMSTFYNLDYFEFEISIMEIRYRQMQK